MNINLPAVKKLTLAIIVIITILFLALQFVV
jgi:hypothetical protein